MTIEIAPSILSANFAKLGEEIKNIEKSGANRVHIDVMDGHYVPNLTFGAPVIKSIRKCTKLPFDVHLMIKPVNRILDSFIDAGADIITFHKNADIHVHRTIQYIKSKGLKVGLALNPSDSLESILPIINDLDQVLIMSVNPGFGGQSFIYSQLNKIMRLKEFSKLNNLSFDIEVDGGIN